jgi:AcrR family transcriptional regulator
LYGYFDSKEVLSHTVVSHLLDRLVSITEAAVNRETTAKKKLFAFLDVYKTPLNPPLQGGCPILNFGVESDDTDPVVRRKVRKVILGALEAIKAVITEGIRNKEFRRDFDAGEFALKAFTLIEGSMMVCKVLNSNKPMQQLMGMLKKEIEGYSLAQPG